MALVDDFADTVKAYKELEQFAVTKMDPEEKAKYLERRVVDTEGALAKITLSASVAEILKKYPAVEAEDIAEATTVSGAEKLAARIQAKAEKVTATVQTDIEKKIQDALKLKDEEMAEVKKAYGRPRAPEDTTQNLLSDAEQKGELGKKLDGGKKFDFDFTKGFRGDMKNVEEVSKSIASQGLEMLLGGRNG